MTDSEGNISLVNNAAEKLFNIKNATEKPLIEVVRDHEMDEVVQVCLKTGPE